MSILVTGGSGFIGSHFIRDWLTHHNEPVINLDCLTYAVSPNVLDDCSSDPRYTFIHANILDEARVDSILTEHHIRAIVHFAAESHVDRSIHGPEIFVQTNVLGTMRLLSSALRHWKTLSPAHQAAFRFLHVSTDEVFGSLCLDEPAFTELSAYAPNSPYSASKAASDHLVRAYYHTYGLPVLTTHCSNNYGPDQYAEKLIPLCIQKALRGEDIPIYGDGLNIRDWLHVNDHCRALRVVLDKAAVGTCYNIGGNNEQTNRHVVQTICSILDDLVPRSDGQSYKNQMMFVHDRAGHDRRYAIDASKIAQELSWEPLETFESGLLKTVSWYVQQFTSTGIQTSETV